MPNDTRAMHPSGKVGITFTEEDHRYVDDFGIEYTSVTTLIHAAFEQFDGPRIAAAKSAKTGVPAELYLAEWEQNRYQAALAGTRMHENCERQILGRFGEMHQPADDDERNRFRAAWHEVEKMRAAFLPATGIRGSLEPEKIIFSPRFRIAGSVDLLARHPTGWYGIFDWKIIKELKRAGFNGRTGIILPTCRIPDCNLYHYALQLAIYEQILKCEGYIEPDATVQRWLNVFNGVGFDHEPLPDVIREALLLMSWNISWDGLERIPF